MDTIKLPPRLSAIAEMVPCGTKLADVGTDHGLVPIFLLQSGRIRSSDLFSNGQDILSVLIFIGHTVHAFLHHKDPESSNLPFRD